MIADEKGTPTTPDALLSSASLAQLEKSKGRKQKLLEEWKAYKQELAAKNAAFGTPMAR